jgi:hypothetical protein
MQRAFIAYLGEVNVGMGLAKLLKTRTSCSPFGWRRMMENIPAKGGS